MEKVGINIGTLPLFIVGTEIFLKKLEQMLGRAIMPKKAGRPRKVT